MVFEMCALKDRRRNVPFLQNGPGGFSVYLITRSPVGIGANHIISLAKKEKIHIYLPYVFDFFPFLDVC